MYQQQVWLKGSTLVKYTKDISISKDKTEKISVLTNAYF